MRSDRVNFLSVCSFAILVAYMLLASVPADCLAASTKDDVSRANEIVRLQGLIEKARAELDRAQKQVPPDSSMVALLSDALARREDDLREFRDQSIQGTTEIQALADSRFSGFGFGIAIAATIDIDSKDRIDSATVDANGIVRIDADRNTRANFMLESHYFFTPGVHKRNAIQNGLYKRVDKGKLVALGDTPETPEIEFRCIDYWSCKYLGLMPGDWGWGPFVAIQPGSDDIIEAVSTGLMIGFKRSAIIAPNLVPGLGDSFNIGLGIAIDPNETVLGDGIRKNQPLPAGETAVRTKETTQTGIVALFSYSF